MAHDIFGLDSFLGIYRQKLHNQVMSLWWNVFPVLLLEIYPIVDDLIFQVNFIVRLERRIPTQQNIEYYTDWPPIDHFPILDSLEYLWGHIKRRSYSSWQKMSIIWYHLRYSKINKFQYPVLLFRRIHTIFGLHYKKKYLKIPVHNTALMQIPYRVNDGTDNVSGLLLSVNLFLNDFLIKLSAGQVLQNQVNVLFVWVEVIELDDVGVLDVLHDVDLAFEQNLLLFVHFLSIFYGDVLLYYLDGHRFACLFFSSLNDFRVASSEIN
mgnify:FL=1